MTINPKTRLKYNVRGVSTKSRTRWVVALILLALVAAFVLAVR